MTSRSGGRIAPDGRSPAPKGVGKRARRHDLERPKTPGLSDSSLQKGDVEELEQGQRISPLPKQNQGAAQNRRSSQAFPARARAGASGSDAPDPMTFLSDRLQGTLASAPVARGPQIENPGEFMPLLRRMATATGASALMAQAYLTQFATHMRRPAEFTGPILDMNAQDDNLEAALRGS